MRLTARQRASWVAHVFKATCRRHHRELIPMFAPLVPEDAVVIDIGAHSGQFAKLFARMASRGRVFAFEPSAYALSILRPALWLNRLRNVTVAPVALSDRAADQPLHTPLKRSGAVGFGLAHMGEERSADSLHQTVRTTTLDAFVEEQRLGRIDLIKADVEGWEMRALRGAVATLHRFHPALYLEIDRRFLARAGDTPEDLFTWLAAMGYEGRTTPGLRPAAQFSGAGDYLFVPVSDPGLTDDAEGPGPRRQNCEDC